MPHSIGTRVLIRKAYYALSSTSPLTITTASMLNKNVRERKKPASLKNLPSNAHICGVEGFIHKRQYCTIDPQNRTYMLAVRLPLAAHSTVTDYQKGS